jgi:hypothetical protein
MTTRKRTDNTMTTRKGQTTQWPQEKGQTTQWPQEKDRQHNDHKKKDRQHNDHKKKVKQRSTKQCTKIKDRVTRTPLKIGCELRCSWRVSSSCSTSGTRRVTLFTNPVINHEWGKGREVLTTSGNHPWSFVTHILRNG